jgi:plastocyanin
LSKRGGAIRRVGWVLVLAAFGLAACGGSAPAAATTPSGSLTITITASGASPRTISVAAGSQVTFINNDRVSHQMFSDPHPEHTDCPELDQVGFLSPGQSRQSGNLNTIRTCGFHDHGDPLNASLQGAITIR